MELRIKQEVINRQNRFLPDDDLFRKEKNTKN